MLYHALWRSYEKWTATNCALNSAEFVVRDISFSCNFLAKKKCTLFTHLFFHWKLSRVYEPHIRKSNNLVNQMHLEFDFHTNSSPNPISIIIMQHVFVSCARKFEFKQLKRMGFLCLNWNLCQMASAIFSRKSFRSTCERLTLIHVPNL